MLIDKYRLDRQDGIQAEFRIVGIKFSPVRSAFRGSRHKRAERGERIPPFPTVFRHTVEILAGKSDFFPQLFSPLLFDSHRAMRSFSTVGRGVRRR